MMAAASTRMLNVDPLMRTMLGGASVAVTWTPFPTPLGSQQNSILAQAPWPAASVCFAVGIRTLVCECRGEVFRFRCRCASPRYANTRLLVYKHTHHVYTHRPRRQPAFRFH